MQRRGMSNDTCTHYQKFGIYCAYVRTEYITKMYKQINNKYMGWEV